MAWLLTRAREGVGGRGWLAVQTLQGSLSAVWTATIARKDAFFSIFRDLQDLHTFAPLQSQKFSKIYYFNLAIFWRLNTHFSAFFEIYKIITLNFQTNCKILQNLGKFCGFWKLLLNFHKILQQFCKISRILKIQLDYFVDIESC